MVYVNNKKFACESCIKGHRSSSCHHTDRPLFEIKKKGRPVSQCEKCRELRQSKRVHSKCTCDEKEDGIRAEEFRTLIGTKSKRFIPIVPALPNGLQDVLSASRVSSTLPADARQRVDSLLNPCNCRSVWKCNCAAQTSGPQSAQERGLNVLARAAAMCDNEASTSNVPPNVHRKSTKRTSSRPGSPNNTHKRSKRINKAPTHIPGPDLPPILFNSVSSSSPQLASSLPTFETMPPISTIASIAGTGCTCGVQCACPGCVEHRGPEHASKSRKDCVDGCGTCVDHTGIALPRTNGSTSSTPNFLDKFFARAAALPAPPTNRKMGVGIDLDPMNIIVYPDVALGSNDRGVAFGLVSLPKLECCGGRCGCPNGICGCGKSCDGCCVEHGAENEEQSHASAPVERPASVVPSEPSLAAPVLRSCCAGRAAAAAVGA